MNFSGIDFFFTYGIDVAVFSTIVILRVEITEKWVLVKAGPFEGRSFKIR